MLYDAINYGAQVTEAERKHGENKYDKLTPVIRLPMISQ
jgi:hypothetical protein